MVRHNMATSNSSSSSGGIGFVGLLTIVFIVLKLIGKIDWSWWWVLSPIWIVASFVVIVLSIVALCYWLTRPKTPAEKVAAACNELSETLRKRR